jgi:hypothetical protein
MALSLALALSACGGDASHPLAGTYVMDVEKTTAAASEGGAAKATTREVASMRQTFATYVLVLSPEGGFDLRSGSFQMDGRWSEAGGVVSLETARSGGEPVSAEDPLRCDAVVEGGWLVLTGDDGRRMYLRRL